jgi:hypothetical protein
MKLFRISVAGFMILFYVALTIFCFRYFFYVEDISMVVFWFISLLINICIIIFSEKKKLKLQYMFCIIVFINFVILALYVFFNGNLNYLKRLTIIEKISQYLFSVVLIIISGNWLLPLIYYYIRKKLMHVRCK